MLSYDYINFFLPTTFLILSQYATQPAQQRTPIHTVLHAVSSHLLEKRGAIQKSVHTRCSASVQSTLIPYFITIDQGI